ncbi:MAG: AI-2E family transporter [Bacteroidetes bacterium]|nr:AI-2E family transporter [Bacteroidota bacterium]
MSNNLYERYKLFFIILIVCVIGFIAWYFSNILICVIVAGVISIIGSPLVDLFDRIRIKKIRFPHVLSVFLALILMLAVLLGLISFFIPLVVKESSLIASIDGQKLLDYYHPQIQWLQNTLIQYGVIAKNATVDSLLTDNIRHFLDISIFSNILSSVITFAGNFFFNFFAILFLSFFFLNDTNMLPRFILLLVPKKYELQTKQVMKRSKEVLSRYFIGLVINVLVMIASYSITLSIAGIRGALVIAFFAGIVNIIPYIGPLIAIATGIILGVTGVVSAGLYGSIGSTAIHVLIAMVIVVLLDNIVYGPMIQGKSVKVHPVEIFLVIIAAGSLGGIPGMIVAVPGYAFLRIVADTFLSQFRIFQRSDELTS